MLDMLITHFYKQPVHKKLALVQGSRKLFYGGGSWEIMSATMVGREWKMWNSHWLKCSTQVSSAKKQNLDQKMNDWKPPV